MMNNLGKQSTLAFLLSVAARKLLPDLTLFIEHSLSDGFYCHFGNNSKLTIEQIDQLAEKMREFVSGNKKIELTEHSYQRLINIFSKEGRDDKVAILNQWRTDPVPTIQFEDVIDYRFEPMTADKSDLTHFKLSQYDEGFILRFPGMDESGEMKPFLDAPKLYQIIKEHEGWGNILGVANIGELNQLVNSGDIRRLIWVAEGLHEKKIADIADGLCWEFPEKRVIFIAGPSSSGKTTFSKRLDIQLMVNGYSTKTISMDDYYLDHDEIPIDESGGQNFEKITALNIELLCRHAKMLVEGKEIPERKFDFNEGKGFFTGKSISIPDDSFIVFEGIHGLNPIFPNRLGKNQMQRIYISALTQLNVDNEHRVSTADNRLLRRLVRDKRYRGYSGDDTLSRWANVREGEEKHIFPFQEEADFMFNSSLIYEIPILARQAVSILKDVSETSSNCSEAQRLLTFLSFFISIPPEHIPEISIVLEFIGGSAFKY